MKSAIDLIQAERVRQGSLGWDPGHDDEHTDDELAKAAAVYATPGYARRESGGVPTLWPWHRKWWKPVPDDRIRELVKAGALIVAEIERLQRAQPTGGN